MRQGVVLVTGGAGFVGATLVRRLVEAGYQVRVLDDLSVGRREHLDGVPLDLVQRPVGDLVALAAALQGVEIVVHLAARPGIPASIVDPVGTFQANVADLVALLDAARTAGVQRFVLASSRAAATASGILPVARNAISPYAAGKLAGEAFCRAYASTYGLTATSLRFANIYGPWSAHKSSVVAVWMRAILGDTPITIHGGGDQLRDFVYVDDIASAVLDLLVAPEAVVAGGTFAVESGRETSILELAGVFDQIVGKPIDRRFAPSRAGEDESPSPVRSPSPPPPLAGIGHPRPATSLEDGLRETLTWFRMVAESPTLAPLLRSTTLTSDD